MGALRDRMTSYMELKGLSPRTMDLYLRQMTCFVRYVGHGPGTMDSEEIRNHLHHLLSERQLSQASVSQAYSALRLFYEQILGKTWEERTIPRAKQRRKLPVVLSPAEVESLFGATRRIKYRALFMTIYSGGLRVQEATHLQLEDIDSQRMLPVVIATAPSASLWTRSAGLSNGAGICCRCPTSIWSSPCRRRGLGWPCGIRRCSTICYSVAHRRRCWS